LAVTPKQILKKRSGSDAQVFVELEERIDNFLMENFVGEPIKFANFNRTQITPGVWQRLNAYYLDWYVELKIDYDDKNEDCSYLLFIPKKV
jgi:hypothetical protein